MPGVGEAVGFTIGVEFGLGVGVTGCIPFAVVVAVLGLTIGLDVGLGFGLEFGFGAGVVVTGVPVVAAELIEFVDGFVVVAAGLVFVVVEDDDALFEFVELLELDVLPPEPVEPLLPPVV